MVSSLAAQLAKGASANAQFLVDRTKRKYAQSFLFTGKEADQYDLDSIHALAVNGFAQLVSLEPSLAQFEELISEENKTLDRTLLNKEEDAELSAKLRLALLKLGSFLLETPTAKFLEWLVRRYRCVVVNPTWTYFANIYPESTNLMWMTFCNCSYRITNLRISSKCYLFFTSSKFHLLT
jgi:hypothetical protein